MATSVGMLSTPLSKHGTRCSWFWAKEESFRREGSAEGGGGEAPHAEPPPCRLVASVSCTAARRNRRLGEPGVTQGPPLRRRRAAGAQESGGPAPQGRDVGAAASAAQARTPVRAPRPLPRPPRPMAWAGPGDSAATLGSPEAATEMSSERLFVALPAQTKSIRSGTTSGADLWVSSKPAQRGCVWSAAQSRGPGPGVREPPLHGPQVQAWQVRAGGAGPSASGSVRRCEPAEQGSWAGRS